jgi:hypothetical protein
MFTIRQKPPFMRDQLIARAISTPNVGLWYARMGIAFLAILMAYPSAANHKVTIKPNGASRFDTIDSPAIQCESAGSPDIDWPLKC